QPTTDNRQPTTDNRQPTTDYTPPLSHSVNNPIAYNFSAHGISSLFWINGGMQTNCLRAFYFSLFGKLSLVKAGKSTA
ncbi:MAG: hypothetical protein FWB99_00790, partial [Treponema sp.]|nr:hypothetical protein [Treponema sp.]